MGMNSYRFSIAWPRILPEGRGRRNEKGLDHYDRVIDALLEAGVDPLVTCFHWDLPATLEDEGGWANREIAHSFADYCELLAERYGDRVRRWCLLNEPQAFTVVGFGWGVFPPGKRDQTLMLRATHTANLALAQGFRAMKAQEAKLQLGFAQDFSLGYPLTGSNADQAAWKRYDAFRNRWFLDPNVTGQYPECFIGGAIGTNELEGGRRDHPQGSARLHGSEFLLRGSVFRGRRGAKPAARIGRSRSRRQA